jgi:uncharacterized protein DUF3105
LRTPDREVTPLSIQSLARALGTDLHGTKVALSVLVAALILTGTACGSGDTTGASDEPEKRQAPEKAEQVTADKTMVMEAATDAAESEATELARAEVGEREIANMLPAGGKKPDPARPLPEDPPEDIEVYPATTNRTVKGPIEYDRQPPTNGDHDPLWQNCGFYEKPIKDRHAVHSMDHGVVWITHRPDLPRRQIEALRPYGDEGYVIVSPYPGQDAPVIATSWRVQLKLEGAEDPRLRQFVEGFRISEISPLSGNRCAFGVGNPKG